ncbi:ABC transporter permease [Natronorubrum texcoconense]|uniref:Putative ABC transport system permease protein n=1 Tax=Natronorubrum texcoconense TaxID=1095776 RepID=A0A1G9AJW4_9EURY|nr:ABC transporter permease [Natronorubrum texcoconense]SDK27568.1 putative ABC transport system permease protein [Natronorubrum texcoconense]
MIEDAIATLLEHASDPEIRTGFAQIGIAVVLTVVVLGVTYVQELGFERELLTTSARGFVQILATGAVIGMLLAAHIAWASVVLAFMIVAAAWISHERGADLPGSFRASLVAIALGSAVVIASMAFAGAIERTMRDLIVVGSMVIAMAMKTNSLALERFTNEISSNRAEIEAVLSVGAPPERVVSEYVSTSIYASLIPILDRIKSLGIVSIPGLMAGMIIAGANPIYAAQYQFVIMLMLFAASAVTCMASTLLVSRYVFTDAKQLDGDVLEAIDG